MDGLTAMGILLLVVGVIGVGVLLAGRKRKG